MEVAYAINVVSERLKLVLVDGVRSVHVCAFDNGLSSLDLDRGGLLFQFCVELKSLSMPNPMNIL